MYPIVLCKTRESSPEMEYIAIRENQRLELINEQTKAMQCQHEGNSWGANTPSFSGGLGGRKSHLNLSAAKLPEACHYSK
jgi:hypothetical protein